MLLRTTVNTLCTSMMISAVIMAAVVNGKVIVKPISSQTTTTTQLRTGSNAVSAPRQLPFLRAANKETSTPDFIRLVVMRFIYGLASNMGVEERLEGLFNGAFVPPNADGDFFGFGGLGSGGDGDGDAIDFGALAGLGDIGALDGLFDDDGL